MVRARATESLLNLSAYTALRRSGSPGFVRRAASGWWSGHTVLNPAARGRWRAAAAQPKGLRLWAHGAASSLRHGSRHSLAPPCTARPKAQRGAYGEIEQAQAPADAPGRSRFNSHAVSRKVGQTLT